MTHRAGLGTATLCLHCGAYPVRQRVKGSSRPLSWPKEEAVYSSCTRWTTSSGDLEQKLTFRIPGQAGMFAK